MILARRRGGLAQARAAAKRHGPMLRPRMLHGASGCSDAARRRIYPQDARMPGCTVKKKAFGGWQAYQCPGAHAVRMRYCLDESEACCQRITTGKRRPSPNALGVTRRQGAA